MRRAIVGYHRDEHGDWVAELDCGHGQHVRHRPPFVLRAWTQTEEGRRAQLGERLDCLRCERLELPERVQPYRRTPEFDARSVPAGLLRSHATRAGVWGRIEVLEGQLRYRVEGARPRAMLLVPGCPGTVAPQMRHEVEPLGPVRFFVEFYRDPVRAPARVPAGAPPPEPDPAPDEAQ